MNIHDVITVPLITEKTEYIKNPMEGVNRYVFRVHPDANKELLRQALYHIYGVREVKINIMKVPGKKKRFRHGKIKMPSWKKAVVKLEPGQSIEFIKAG